MDDRPLVMHILHRFDTGGLENGVVNLINHMPDPAYRHMVVALTEVTAFARRLRKPDVQCHALHKPSGHGARVYPALLRLIREHRPSVVHTRNLGPLEMQAAAALARVPARIHGEHGRELDDLDGSNRKNRWLRRLYSPFVHRYVALSDDLERYLVDRVHIAPGRIRQICNGVDADRFRPAAGGCEAPAGFPFGPGHWTVGTVGRLQGVKNQTLLARAFVRALERAPDLRPRLRLVIVGDGPLRDACATILRDGGVDGLAWLAGERGDVPDVMRAFNCFVLPSLAEGISNTILEAMASGLPVIATAVGGNAQLVQQGVTGELVPSDDTEALATAILQLAGAPERAAEMGRAARWAVEQRYSLQSMVAAYQQLYDEQLSLARQGRRSG